MRLATVVEHIKIDLLYILEYLGSTSAGKCGVYVPFPHFDEDGRLCHDPTPGQAAEDGGVEPAAIHHTAA